MKRWLIGFLLLVRGCAPQPVWAQSADMIPLQSAVIVDSPADIASWPATVRIDRITFGPTQGLSFDRSGADWPNFTPAGWDGPIQYTVWACHESTRWTCVGLIQMWRDRVATGAPLPSNSTFWWGPQAGNAVHQPFGSYAAKPGDTLAFFLSAGNARDESGVTSVRERSNAVTVVLPDGDAGVFAYPQTAQPANPAPPAVPAPAPLPEPTVPAIPSTPVPPVVEVVPPPPPPAPAPVPVILPPAHAKPLHWWEYVGVALVGALYLLTKVIGQ